MIKVQIKRGSKAKLPALAAGEFGLATDAKELYLGGAGERLQIPILRGGRLPEEQLPAEYDPAGAAQEAVRTHNADAGAHGDRFSDFYDRKTMDQKLAEINGEMASTQDGVREAIRTAQSCAAELDGKIDAHDTNPAAHSALLERFVPVSRTINGKALSGNVTLSAADVGALAGKGMPEYASNSDQTESSFNAWLDQQLSGMENDTAKAFVFVCYPAISGSTNFGILFRRNYDYAGVLGFGYDMKLFLKQKFERWNDAKSINFGNLSSVSMENVSSAERESAKSAERDDAGSVGSDDTNPTSNS